MVEDDVWRVADLLNPDEPFIQDVKLARKMLDTLESLDALDREYTDDDMNNYSDKIRLNVRKPKAALEFIENTLSDWFDSVAEIERRRGNMPYLIDRSLYPEGKIEWNQGLKLSDLEDWTAEGLDTGFLMDDHFYRRDKITKSKEPLSGYYNRLLPIKFVLRVFAMMIFNSDSWDKENGWDLNFDESIKLKDLRENAWKTASYAKHTLVQMENNLGLERGGEISIGFPSDSVKSKERFVAQFIGSVRRGKVSGALFEMGFVNVPGMLGLRSSEIHLTREGLHFAMIKNPVIDSVKNWEKGNSFSEDETTFLILHFLNNVPAEYELINQIANMISEGKNTAISMNTELISTRGLDRTKASILRTGVVARMQEMGLIDREKSGVEVTVSVTKLGKKLLKLK